MPLSLYIRAILCYLLLHHVTGTPYFINSSTHFPCDGDTWGATVVGNIEIPSYIRSYRPKSSKRPNATCIFLQGTEYYFYDFWDVSQKRNFQTRFDNGSRIFTAYFPVDMDDVCLRPVPTTVSSGRIEYRNTTSTRPDKHVLPAFLEPCLWKSRNQLNTNLMTNCTTASIAGHGRFLLTTDPNSPASSSSSSSSSTSSKPTDHTDKRFDGYNVDMMSISALRANKIVAEGQKENVEAVNTILERFEQLEATNKNLTEAMLLNDDSLKVLQNIQDVLIAEVNSAHQQIRDYKNKVVDNINDVRRLIKNQMQSITSFNTYFSTVLANTVREVQLLDRMRQGRTLYDQQLFLQDLTRVGAGHNRVGQLRMLQVLRDFLHDDHCNAFIDLPYPVLFRWRVLVLFPGVYSRNRTLGSAIRAVDGGVDYVVARKCDGENNCIGPYTTGDRLQLLDTSLPGINESLVYYNEGLLCESNITATMVDAIYNAGPGARVEDYTVFKDGNRCYKMHQLDGSRNPTERGIQVWTTVNPWSVTEGDGRSLWIDTPLGYSRDTNLSHVGDIMMLRIWYMYCNNPLVSSFKKVELYKSFHASRTWDTVVPWVLKLYNEKNFSQCNISTIELEIDQSVVVDFTIDHTTEFNTVRKNHTLFIILDRQKQTMVRYEMNTLWNPLLNFTKNKIRELGMWNLLPAILHGSENYLSSYAQDVHDKLAHSWLVSHDNLATSLSSFVSNRTFYIPYVPLSAMVDNLIPVYGLFCKPKIDVITYFKENISHLMTHSTTFVPTNEQLSFLITEIFTNFVNSKTDYDYAKLFKSFTDYTVYVNGEFRTEVQTSIDKNEKHRGIYWGGIAEANWEATLYNYFRNGDDPNAIEWMDKVDAWNWLQDAISTVTRSIKTAMNGRTLLNKEYIHSPNFTHKIQKIFDDVYECTFTSVDWLPRRIPVPPNTNVGFVHRDSVRANERSLDQFQTDLLRKTQPETPELDNTRPDEAFRDHRRAKGFSFTLANGIEATRALRDILTGEEQTTYGSNAIGLDLGGESPLQMLPFTINTSQVITTEVPRSYPGLWFPGTLELGDTGTRDSTPIQVFQGPRDFGKWGKVAYVEDLSVDMLVLADNLFSRAKMDEPDKVQAPILNAPTQWLLSKVQGDLPLACFGPPVYTVALARKDGTRYEYWDIGQSPTAPPSTENKPDTLPPHFEVGYVPPSMTIVQQSHFIHEIRHGTVRFGYLPTPDVNSKSGVNVNTMFRQWYTINGNTSNQSHLQGAVMFCEGAFSPDTIDQFSTVHPVAADIQQQTDTSTLMQFGRYRWGTEDVEKRWVDDLSTRWTPTDNTESVEIQKNITKSYQQLVDMLEQDNGHSEDLLRAGREQIQTNKANLSQVLDQVDQILEDTRSRANADAVLLDRIFSNINKSKEELEKLRIESEIPESCEWWWDIYCTYEPLTLMGIVDFIISGGEEQNGEPTWEFLWSLGTWCVFVACILLCVPLASTLASRLK